MNIRRVAASLLAAGAVTTGIALIPAPASAADPAVYQFIPTRLECHDFEDYWPDWKDEINLYYGTAVYSNFNMHLGAQAHDLPPVTFTGSRLRFDLKEWDRGFDNNHLGTDYATTVNLGEEQALHFQGNGWSYNLYGKVVQVS